jgi:acetyl esterase/lipase
MIRLVFIILLFFTSLLALFKAPMYYLWLLAIVVTEFPLVFVGITSLVVISGAWGSNYRLAGNVLGIITLIIFLTPVIRAYWIAKDLKQEMAIALNGPNTRSSALLFKKDTQPFSFWKMFSRTGSIPYRTLTYVTYPDISLGLDFYPSQATGKRPCVIVVHGGSWSSGDSKQLAELNSYLAKVGYNVAAINYRMAPEYQSPAPVQDVQASLKYLQLHADELNIDTNKFVLLGRSAGAQIALLAAYTLHNEGIKGIIDFYGPADMVWGYSAPASPLVMDSRGVMERYLGGPYQHVPQNYKMSSPLAFVNRQTVPTLIIHGYNDVLVAYEHSRRLNEKLQQNGIKHYWLKLPWATHGFDFNLTGPGGQLSTYAVEAFLGNITQ